MKAIIFMGHTSKGCTRPAMSKLEWERIIVACAFRCFYCANLLTLSGPDSNLTDDHLVPKITGGCECCGNRVAACLRCNAMKGQRSIEEFLHMKPQLVQTSGTFYTGVTSLGAITDPANDPMLREIRRLSEKMRFPDIPSYREPEESSFAWRNPR